MSQDQGPETTAEQGSPLAVADALALLLLSSPSFVLDSGLRARLDAEQARSSGFHTLRDAAL